MNEIKVISFGKIRESYILQGIDEYSKRLSAFCKLSFVELKEEGIAKESEKVLKYNSESTFLLDDKGKEMSSIEFASFLKQNEQVAFIIGSSDGILPEVKKQFRLVSLSKMTFLHEMTKLILLEQIYRGYMINAGRVY